MKKIEPYGGVPIRLQDVLILYSSLEKLKNDGCDPSDQHIMLPGPPRGSLAVYEAVFADRFFVEFPVFSEPQVVHIVPLLQSGPNLIIHFHVTGKTTTSIIVGISLHTSKKTVFQAVMICSSVSRISSTDVLVKFLRVVMDTMCEKNFIACEGKSLTRAVKILRDNRLVF
ncbi:hypothetical protein EV368DRAFT_68526 [Lentinula lateritia]|nr:hypothetical protein EV368DRAFT_68526 [Lentinula lateritia]